MIRAIIIDDEAHCIQSLKNDLTECCPQVTLVAEANNGKEGLLAIKEHHPDLVFLDVAMPWMNGFEMLELLPSVGFAVIFTTAHDQFAALAFRKSAVDYLLKPIDKTDLKEAIRKVEQQWQGSGTQAKVDNLISNYRQPEQAHKIALPFREGYEFVETSKINYCEAEGAYTRIHLADNRVMLVSRSLGDIAELLPTHDFIRIHHSTVVNVSSVTHFIRSDGGYVQMKNGSKLMVSKSRKEAVMERLGLR
jgi:two-component system, LytTR family, response regulator